MSGRIERLEDRIYSYRFFSYVFLALPDEEFVRQMLAYPDDDDSEGGMLVRKWAVENVDASLASVLESVSVDRTRLFRGLSEVGPVPPYESLFVGGSKDNAVALSSVAACYAKIGFQQMGGVHDSPEYLGNELAFMDQVLSSEFAALEEGDDVKADGYRQLGDDFFRQHVGTWVLRYVQEMFQHTRTDLYRGLALMFEAFVKEETAACV